MGVRSSAPSGMGAASSSASRARCVCSTRAAPLSCTLHASSRQSARMATGRLRAMVPSVRERRGVEGGVYCAMEAQLQGSLGGS